MIGRSNANIIVGSDTRMLAAVKTSYTIPNAMRGVGATMYDGKLYACGGYSSGGGFSSAITVKTFGGTDSTGTLTAPVYTPLVLTCAGKIYVIGGMNNNGRIKTIQKIDPADNTCAVLSIDIGAGRSGVSGVTVGRKMVLIGGEITDSTSSTTIQVITVAGDGTESISTLTSTILNVSNGAVVNYGDYIYLFGGIANPAYGSARNNIYKIDIVNDSITTAGTLHTAVCRGGAFVSGNKAYICGGAAGVFTSSDIIQVYDFASETTMLFTGLLMPEKICLYGCAAGEDYLYAVGGYEAKTTITKVYI